MKTHAPFFFWVLLIAGSVSVGAQDVLDGIVAVVGDEIILRSEWLQEAQGMAMMQRIDPMTQPEAFNRLKRAVLENLVQSRILLAKAKEDTITVDDQTVQAELDARIQHMVRQLGSEEKVAAYFGKSISRIRKDFFEEQKKMLIVSKVQQKKLQGVQVSRREVEQFYRAMKDSLPLKPPMVKMRHILREVRPSEEARQQAFERIRAIQDQLKAGESFEALARRYSEDTGSAARGGELGFVESGTLLPEFEEVAFRLKDGEISDVVETRYGFHLIQMIENQGDRVNCRHILVRVPTTAEDERRAYEEISQIRARILAGESFAAMAEAYSDDAESRPKGGDLGWLPKNEIQIREFRLVADTLEVGKVSGIFKTQFGYHLMMLDDKEEAAPWRLDQDWDRIQALALQAKQQRILSEWIEELKKRVYVDIREELL